MNSVSLIGNLATEIDLRDVREDKKVAGFLLAVDRGGSDGGADFVSITVWDRQAELCAEYLRKGRRVGVTGRLRSQSWDEEGRRRTRVDVVAHRVDFLSGPRSEEALSDTPFGAAAGGEVIPFDVAAS